MISWLSGRIIEKKPTSVILDVGGVGYGVYISLQTFYSLPEEGEEAQLFVHTSVREDAIQLFGFSAAGEKDMFKRLISVSKIGPKMAINILSGVEYAKLIEAVRGEDVARLSSIPGIGKKTAERMILELKDKFKGLELAPEYERAPSHDVFESVVEALVSLGYKKPEAGRAVETVRSESPSLSLEEALKESLKIIG